MDKTSGVKIGYRFVLMKNQNNENKNEFKSIWIWIANLLKNQKVPSSDLNLSLICSGFKELKKKERKLREMLNKAHLVLKICAKSLSLCYQTI